ncbi:MAG: SDR family NAD(P)-dependent oxidoreductase [Bacteroidetes bacterium]|nr:SDR family NAD(P)-dependent oxidoreductase [Bacteroidota bacterium]
MKTNSILKIFDLTGRTAILTGSAGRLGKYFANILGEAGANLVLIDINEQKNNQLAKSIKKKYHTKTSAFRIDISNKDITGKQAEISLEKAGITVNKNMVPFDTRSPFVTSGIRIGTPAVTTRGMKENEMSRIADIINSAIQNFDNEEKLEELKTEVKELCSGYPLYLEIK